VLGAAVGPAPASNPINSAVRQLPKLAGNPRSTTAWILGGIAALIILLLGLTFVMHLQVQPTDLLLPGVAVAGIALFLLSFNTLMLGGASISASASAELSQNQGVVLTDYAAATTR
jgi:hypothetical protein